ncbi:MAG: GAF domain-containing protein [Chloroflexota bacterium]
MQKIFRTFFLPPTFGDEDKTLSASFLHWFTLFATGISLILLVAYWLSGAMTQVGMVSIIIGIFILSNALNHFGQVLPASIFLLLTLWLAIGYLAYTSSGVRDAIVIAYIALAFFASVLVNWRASIVILILSIAVIWTMAILEYSAVFTPALDEPTIYARGLTFIYLLVAILIISTTSSLRRLISRARKVSARLILNNQELEKLRNDLESRVAERSTEIERVSWQVQRRAKQLETISELAKSAISVQDLDQFLEDITRLIADNFGYYHVGIFLTDDKGEYVVIKAASSAGGKRMLARGHKLPLGTTSAVGYAAQYRQPRVVANVAEDAVHLSNPDLPDTRAELALPLRIGDRTIGVLDVQSNKPGIFTQDDIIILGTLADQLAIALENTRLLNETRQALAEAENAYEKYVRQAWKQASSISPVSGFRYTDNQLIPITEPLTEESYQKVISVGGMITSDEHGPELAIPVKLRGQVLGVLHVRSKDTSRRWTPDDIALTQAAAERAALALENARLLVDAQQRATKERTISELTAKIGESPVVERIMRVTVDELRTLIGASEVVLKMSMDTETE